MIIHSSSLTHVSAFAADDGYDDDDDGEYLYEVLCSVLQPALMFVHLLCICMSFRSEIG